MSLPTAGALVDISALQRWHPSLVAWLQTQDYSWQEIATRHGDAARWLQALHALPTAVAAPPCWQDGKLVFSGPQGLEPLLKALSPWRKGPFQVGDCYIDTEWRSDWKWQRLEAALGDVSGKQVLDVGCGNGFHLWCLWLAGAKSVLGIDPSLLFCIQFQALYRLLQTPVDIVLLPVSLEDFAAPSAVSNGLFDVILSMGVIYHRRDPFAHLHHLRQHLKPGGQLLLESIVVPGDAYTTLVPQKRYSRMRNVWFIPSAAALVHWCLRAGFVDAKIIDDSPTTTQEQRSTAWMPFESLAQSLSADQTQTVEGYPAPRRAIISAWRDT